MESAGVRCTKGPPGWADVGYPSSRRWAAAGCAAMLTIVLLAPIRSPKYCSMRAAARHLRLLLTTALLFGARADVRGGKLRDPESLYGSITGNTISRIESSLPASRGDVQASVSAVEAELRDYENKTTKIINFLVGENNALSPGHNRDGTNGLNGINGLTGMIGGTGPSGLMGTSGATGPTGVGGFIGSTGASGSTGLSGLMGTTGATGSTGQSGLMGTAGATGSTGQSGFMGTTGAMGLTGQSGLTGSTGASGTTGATGFTGLTGATNITGSPALPSNFLAAGGQNTRNALASAEVYNSTVGTWTATGSLATARYSLGMVQLPNNNVLAAGGSTGGFNPHVLASAEVYDPAKGIWTATGSLAVARFNFQMILLPNGNALAAGGQFSADQTATTTAEVYNPTGGIWTATGSLTAARYQFQMVLLPNGNVLAAGGYSNNTVVNSVLASTEVYNTTVGMWSSTGSLAEARNQFQMVLLPNGKVLAAGGVGNDGLLASAEVYDPATGIWTATGSLAVARYTFSMVSLLSGIVLAAGGTNGGVLASAEEYNISTGIWTVTNSLVVPRFAFPMMLLPNGNALAATGTNRNDALASAEVYNSTVGMWSATGSLIAGRYSFSMVGL